MICMNDYEQEIKKVIEYARSHSCDRVSLTKMFDLLISSVILPKGKSDVIDNCQPTICLKHGFVGCTNLTLDYEDFYCLKCICEIAINLLKSGEFQIAKLQWKEKTNGTLENCASGENNEATQTEDL